MLVIISVKFQKFHNVGADRVAALAKVSFQDSPSLGKSATAFGVFLNDSVFSVTVAHPLCVNFCRPNAIACDGIDVALILACPASGFALDGSQYVNSSTGDDAYVKGFSDVNVNSYKASIGNEYGQSMSNPPFQDLPILKPNYRMLVGSSQSSGLSGSCVLNGYGIVGVAVAEKWDIRADGTEKLFTSLVVPWYEVLHCIKKLQKTYLFPKFSNCSKVSQVLVPTLLNGVEVVITKALRHPLVEDFFQRAYHYL
jgi:hypothetical protein